VSKVSPKPSVASQQGWDIRRGRLFFLGPAPQPASTNLVRLPGHKFRLGLFFIATESQYLHNDGVPDAAKPINLPPLSLASACCGQKLRVVSLPVSGVECLRLRELGLCERSLVSKLGDGAAILCSFSGVRMAVGRALGAQVLVEAITV
jgi:ferrous iron transport protein A